ncbi:MAG: orotidine-5'-phosphate decarboxylase [Candidatus Portnoybacteria bacterium]
MSERKAKDCLIVGADFQPKEEGGRKGVREKVMELGEELKGMGVYIKINSILRACGYDLINDLHNLGLRVVADLKLKDIPETMETDAMLLSEFSPDIVTVLADASVDGMFRVKQQLKNSEILGVTILTSYDEDECQQIYICSVKAGVVRLARLANAAGLDGLVLAAKEIEVIKHERRPDLARIAINSNTPAIRPVWSVVEGDDQAKKRIVTPAKAIGLGAKRIIVGRPIIRNDDPRAAAQRTLDEIQGVLEGN